MADAVATTTPAPQAPPEVARMTKLQKLAMFLTMLGPDHAAPLLKGLDEYQLDQVTAEMVKIAAPDKKIQEWILREFVELANNARKAEASQATSGPVMLRRALEKAFNGKTAEIMARLPSASSQAKAIPANMQKLIHSDPVQLLKTLQDEQPQTITTVMGFLAPKEGAQMLDKLSPELREAVIERLATLETLPAEAVDKLAAMLLQKLQQKFPVVAGATRTTAQSVQATDGTRTAARVLNYMSKNSTDTILASFDKRHPELCEAIRDKMFTFEDLSRQESSVLQAVLRESEPRTLAMALKTASEAVKTGIFKGLSKRAADNINEEISFIGKFKPDDVVAAQREIMQVTRRLKDAGQIELVLT